MRSLKIGLMLAAFIPAAAAAAPVKVNIAWDYKDVPARVEIHELKGKPRLWETASVKALDPAQIGEAMQDSGFVMEPGQNKRFALVVNNKSGKPAFFFAAPHVVHPAEHSLGFKFKCLCINHAFRVEAGESWYRIVELRLSRDFVGSELTVTHTIIGIDQARAEDFSTQSDMPDM
jgi:hypothetical protein